MNPGRQIKAVSFDDDMTLWDFQKVMRQSLAITLAELRQWVPGRASADMTVEKMVEIRYMAEANLRGETVGPEAIRLEGFKRTVERVGCTDDGLVAELNALYMKHRFEDIDTGFSWEGLRSWTCVEWERVPGAVWVGGTLQLRGVLSGCRRT